MLVDELLSASAERLPEKPALICGDDRWTYRRIDEASARMAAMLVAAGARPPDRVAIWLENSIEAVVSLFGALKAGCTFVIVNPLANVDHARAVVRDSGARVLVARSMLPGPHETICVDSTFRHAIDAGTVRLRPFHARSDQDVAALVYTSGSTGEPKGVMLTHRNITSAAAAISIYLGNTEDDVILNALPLAFTYGLGQVTTAFRVGATVVLERSFSYPRAIIETIERERVTGLPLVPTTATLLLRQQFAANRAPTLRYLTNAAAALPPPKMHRLMEAYPKARLFSMYGQTECQRVSYLPPEEIAARPESVGIPIPGTTAFVADEAGVRVRAGVVGELVVRGPHVMAGYWNRPEATRAVLRPDAMSGERELRTGDLFRADSAGFLYFVERKDDIVKCGGEKVAPRFVERVIAELPGVADVAVFGVPHDLLGEILAAAVTPMPGVTLTADDVRRYCLRRLDANQVPRIVSVRGSLPTTLTGKVCRRMLRNAAIAERWSA